MPYPTIALLFIYALLPIRIFPGEMQPVGRRILPDGGFLYKITFLPDIQIQVKTVPHEQFSLNFDPGKNLLYIATAEKSILKLVKQQSLVAKYCKYRKI